MRRRSFLVAAWGALVAACGGAVSTVTGSPAAPTTRAEATPAASAGASVAPAPSATAAGGATPTPATGAPSPGGPAAPAGSPAPTDTARPSAQASTQPGAPARQRIAFTDAHNHWASGVSASAVIADLDRVGVTRCVMMRNGNDHQDPLVIAKAYPDRIVPFLGLLNGRRDRAAITAVDRDLASGSFAGMGELKILHYAVDVNGNTGARVEIPGDSPWVVDLMGLAAKHNLPLVVHMETTDATVAAFDRALAVYPDAKVVWAHQAHTKTLNGETPDAMRRADPAQVAALLAKYPNLYADLAPGHEVPYLTPADDTLPEAWRALYERFADRFVVGLDRPYASNWQPTPFNERASLQRTWLAQLTPATQTKVASANFERILAAKPSTRTTIQLRTT